MPVHVKIEAMVVVVEEADAVVHAENPHPETESGEAISANPLQTVLIATSPDSATTVDHPAEGVREGEMLEEEEEEKEGRGKETW